MNTSPCYVDDNTGLPVHVAKDEGCSCTPLKPDDPSYFLLTDGFTTKPVEGIYRDDCFICRDPEFAQMGLPLCNPCPYCSNAPEPASWQVLEDLTNPRGHVAADDENCDDCGQSLRIWLEGER